MITEFVVAAGLVCSYNYLTSNKYKIKKIFEDVCENNNMEYKILEIKENEIGYKLIVNLYGKKFKKLEDSKDLLESSFGYNIEIKQNNNLKTATVYIIKEKLTDKIKFKPYTNIKHPYELYLGQTLTRKNIVINMNKYPHCLVSGQTGCGKTEEIRLILTNLIYNFTNRDINIYFSDLSDTNDYDIFKNCKQVKGYAKNITESQQLFEYLMHLYSKRLNIFASRCCKNITEYNKNNKEKRMSYIYLILDEFADYFPSNKYDKNYQEKIKCYNLLRQVVRKFRKVGIFLIIAMQRPDTTVLDPSLKSGLCTKIGFSQNNQASSLVVADTTELTNIEQRMGLFMYGNKREWFRSLYINDKIIRKYIKDSNSYNKKDFNKFLKNNVKSKNVPIKIKKNKKCKSKVKICI